MLRLLEHLPETTKGVIFDLDGTLYDSRWYIIRVGIADFRHVIWLLSDRAGLPVPEKWKQEYFLPTQIRVLKRYYQAREGLSQLLAKLRQQGMRIAVYSDYGRVPEKLEALGINPEQFDVVASSEELGGRKPNKQATCKLLKMMGTVAKETIIIGDRCDTDGVLALQAKLLKFINVKRVLK